MEVVGILGDRGSFKTCRMTSSLFQSHEQGHRITANYRLNFPYQHRSFQQVRDELKLMEKRYNSDDPYVPSFKGHKLAFDELSTGADSYEFLLTHVKELTWFVSQLRKLGCSILYTDQRFGKVVKRIRDQTDYFVLMRDADKGQMRHPNGRLAERHREVCGGIAKYVITDDDLQPIRRGRERTFNGRPWYTYYNTDELIFDTRPA